MASFTPSPGTSHSRGRDTAPRIRGLSMFDPLFIGIDEFGQRVDLDLVYRNILAGGEPGGGKIRPPQRDRRPRRPVAGLPARAPGRQTRRAGHVAPRRGRVRRTRPRRGGQGAQAAASRDGPPLRLAPEATTSAKSAARSAGRSSWSSSTKSPCSRATLGTKQQQDEFNALLRDLVARGRACGIPVVAATQRPSFDIIPTVAAGSVRLPGGVPVHHHQQLQHRVGPRLGRTRLLSQRHLTRSTKAKRCCSPRAGFPKRIKVGYLSDRDILSIAARAARLRNIGPTAT